MRIYRDLFTGEVKEVPSEGGGRQIIARIDPPYGVRKTYSTAFSTPLRSRAIGVIPQQAAEMNEAVKKAGIVGVHYDMKTGDCLFESNRARNREMQRREVFDGDASYGQYAGR